MILCHSKFSAYLLLHGVEPTIPHLIYYHTATDEGVEWEGGVEGGVEGEGVWKGRGCGRGGGEGSSVRTLLHNILIKDVTYDVQNIKHYFYNFTPTYQSVRYVINMITNAKLR